MNSSGAIPPSPTMNALLGENFLSEHIQPLCPLFRIAFYFDCNDRIIYTHTEKIHIFHIYVKYMSYLCVVIKRTIDMNEVELVLVNDTDKCTIYTI